MSFLWTHWKQSAARTGWRTWVLFLLLPLLAGGVRLALPAEDAAAPVQVGVVLPREGGEAFWEKLEQRSGLVTVFLQAGEAQAERQVAAGRWDCALLLPEDFAERLARQDTYQLVTLLTGPGSTVYPMVRETAAACLMELLAPGTAADYLLDVGIVDAGGLEAEEPPRVLVHMRTADGRALEPLELASGGRDTLLAGLTAIVLLIWVLLTAVDLGRWLESPLARRLRPLRGTTALLLPRLGLCPALCSGALALLAADCPWAFLPPLLPYLLFWGAAALALARWRAAWSALPVLMPFVPAAGLLLSPVLMDLSLLFPALAPVSRWLPVTLYLRACAGCWEDAALLAAAGLALLGGQWCADRAGGWRANLS